MTGDEWLVAAAEALGVDPPEGQDDLLDLTREIAHGVERRMGPLTLLMLGQAVGAGGDREALVARLRALL